MHEQISGRKGAATDAATASALGTLRRHRLVAILWVALVASIPFVGVHAVYIWTAAAAAVAIAISATSIGALTRGSVRTRAALHRLVAALPGRWQPRVGGAVDSAATQILHLLANGTRSRARRCGPP